MKCIFVGNVVPNDVFPNISYVSPSTNNVQLKYIDYLNEIFGSDLYVVSLHYGTQRLNEQRSSITPKYNFITHNGIEIRTVSFRNNRLLLNFSGVASLYKELAKLRNLFDNDRFLFVVNNHFYAWLLPAFLARQKDDYLITILNEGFDVRYLREHKIGIKDYIHNTLHRFMLTRNDGLITFCKRTVEENAPNVPYIPLLHSCEVPKKFYESPLINSEKKTVLYAGLFNSCYGISRLIEAMKLLPQEYQLVLCGGGDHTSVKLVEDAAKEDDRIVYLGMISKNEVLQLERNVDVLAMIRISKTISEKYIATYCQPSKLPEYLLSGTPVISTAIEGIPAELLIFINKTTGEPEHIAEIVMKICESEKKGASEKAASGKRYAEEHCTPTVQKEAFNSFIKQICGIQGEK